MKRLLAFGCILFFVFSCRDGKAYKKIPKDIIPVDTMIAVMSDINVMENAIKQSYPQLVVNKEVIKNSGDTILSKYHLNFDRYERSLEYYLFYQDTMNYIYDKMSDRIGAQINELK